jgi:hypothetical protein
VGVAAAGRLKTGLVIALERRLEKGLVIGLEKGPVTGLERRLEKGLVIGLERSLVTGLEKGLVIGPPLGPPDREYVTYRTSFRPRALVWGLVGALPALGEARFQMSADPQPMV